MIETMSLFDPPPPPPAVTVKVADPIATVLSVLVYCAEMVVVPWAMAVATPAAETEATCGLLELQATKPFRLTVAPEAVVPVTEKSAVSGGAATVCEPGVMVNAVTSLPVGLTPPPPPPEPLTVSVASATRSPVYPLMLALMVVVPAVTPVATPAALMVATLGELEAQVTWLVMFEVVPG